MGKKINLQSTPIVWLVAMLCCFLWGSAFPMIKIGYSVLSIESNQTSTIMLFAGIRFFLAGVLTVFIFSSFQKKLLLPKKESVPKICLLSLFQTVLQYVFFYLGLAYTTGTKASVVNGTSVFIAFLLSSLVFKQEKMKLSKLFGCILGFVGVALATLLGSSSSFNLQIGDLFILLSSVSYSFSSVLMKKYSKAENPALLSGYQFIVGGLIMSTFAFIIGGRISLNLKGIAIIVYLAFVSAVAYSLWSILLKYNNVSKIAVCGSMTPIFGFALSYILLGEKNGSVVNNLIGLVFVVLGIVIVNIKKEHKAP